MNFSGIAAVHSNLLAAAHAAKPTLALSAARPTIATVIAISLTLAFSPVAHAQSTDDQTTAAAQSADKATSTSHLNLRDNECLNALDDRDIVIASIAFKDGVNGFDQLKELVKRKPWGIVNSDTRKEIEDQIKTLSPFLIIRLTKKQALTLDDHRDIILWVLVQSTSKPCK